MKNGGSMTMLVMIGIAAALMFGHFGPMGLVILGVIAFLMIK